MLAWRSRKHYLGGLRRVRLHLDIKSFHCTPERGATFFSTRARITNTQRPQVRSSSARLTPFRALHHALYAIDLRDVRGLPALAGLIPLRLHLGMQTRPPAPANGCEQDEREAEDAKRAAFPEGGGLSKAFDVGHV